MINIENLFHALSFLALAISLLIAIVLNIKKWHKPFIIHVLNYFFIASASVEVVSFILARVYHQNNLYCFHLFALIEFALMSLFYFDFYEKNAIKLPKFSIISPILGLMILNLGNFIAFFS